jgi:hypothetical protein
MLATVDYAVLMSTVAEIKAALPKLGDDELQQIEQTVHQLYRARGTPTIYDDAYGVWTEGDQVSAAAEAFQMSDKPEDRAG